MSKQGKPDILLIVLDTLRADRLSCYGYERPTSPHIDAFAEDGVLFEYAISPAQWTIPAHASFFTGEYPTTHLTTQIYDTHNKDVVTLAEALHGGGYCTIGFCNNPLLGVVENNLDQGFEEVYNYGGAIPNRPPISDARPRQVGRMLQHVLRRMGRWVTPIQDVFARNNRLLRVAMHPWLAPLWQRCVNFKGNTVQSLRDVVGYMRTRQHKGAERPVFAFINLMETHLPYGPPLRFIRKFAPYYLKDREARKFMRDYNRAPYRWMIPLTEPLTELQDRVINDLYDAEVAYEDHLLGRLLAYLDRPEIRENTMVIITSDHGEGLNNHDFVGHSLVAYDDLVRVPLIVRYPQGYPQGERISTPVSTRRIFHTVLEVADLEPPGCKGSRIEGALLGSTELSLARSLDGRDPEDGVVFTEAYTPETLLALMEGESQDVIEFFRCGLMRRAAYRDGYKLITVGDEPDELFDVAKDPAELENLIGEEAGMTAELGALLDDFVSAAEARRPTSLEASDLCLEDEAAIAERLRGLGYIE